MTSIIPIIFEDDYLLVLSKPAGFLTLPDRYDKSAPNLKNYLEKIYDEIFVVHRLDKDTSGIIVFAKDSETHKALNQQFEQNQVTKIYHVVVSGVIIDDEIKIDIPISQDLRKPGRSKPSATGKDSLTILRVLERFRNTTLVECNLVTGRHHQIRVHCSAIGHPLLVDDFYGKSDSFFLSSIKRKYKYKKDVVERPIISRVTMHSYSIEFLHPVTKERIFLEAYYPKDFEALLKMLRKYNKISV
ncbi:MAG: RluA family pseudouridine synthase [Candidatus Kapabacteria bacterium]|nr:RluA family pseudouridine synthase [Candidatus Kapabacteria bacterium]